MVLEISETFSYERRAFARTEGFFIRPKESNMLSERFMLFYPIELKLYLGFSDIPNNEMTNSLYVCDSVIL